MTMTSKVLIPGTDVPTTQATLYTAENVRAVMTAVTAMNTTAVAAVLTLNLIESGGTVTATNRVITRTIAAGETYTMIELSEHALSVGGYISAIASVSGISLRVSGWEIT